MSGSDGSKKFTQAQQNSLQGRDLGSFAKGKDLPFVSLSGDEGHSTHDAGLSDSQASGLASFFAAKLKTKAAYDTTGGATDWSTSNGVWARAEQAKLSSFGQVYTNAVKSTPEPQPSINKSLAHLEANTPQRATVIKAEQVLNNGSNQAKEAAQVRNGATNGLNNSNQNSPSALIKNALVRSMGQNSNHANVIKPNHVLAENASNAFATSNLDRYDQASLSGAKTKSNTVSLESLGPLVSLNARLLQEFYYLNFSRYDAVIADMQLNGLHVPLVVVNPNYGVLLIHLCSESYDELIRNPQLIHNNKKHFLHVRDQFVKHFAEPNNEFSLQDLKHVTYVLQCYEKLSAQEVVKLFPAQSILNSPNHSNPSKVFTRWPVSGMVQRVHAHLDRLLVDPNAASNENSRHNIKWMCKASQIPFYLANAPTEASLFESLAIPPLDRAHKEVGIIINQRAHLRGQFSKFARPSVEQVLRPRNTTVEFEGQAKTNQNAAITIDAQVKRQQGATVVGAQQRAPANRSYNANANASANVQGQSIKAQRPNGSAAMSRPVTANKATANNAMANNMAGANRMVNQAAMSAKANPRAVAGVQPNAMPPRAMPNGNRMPTGANNGMQMQANMQARAVASAAQNANANRGLQINGANSAVANKQAAMQMGNRTVAGQSRNNQQGVGLGAGVGVTSGSVSANGNDKKAHNIVNAERVIQQGQKAAQLLKSAPQKLSQGTRVLEQKINAHANPMVMVGSFDFE